MKYNLILFIILFLHNKLQAETYNPAIQTWIISAETAPCETSNNNECLLYKSGGKKEFEILYEPIEGFQFVKGNEYTIQVKQDIKKPPIAANESVFKYVLVKIVSQKSTAPTPTVTSSSNQIIFEVNFEALPCEEDPTKSCLLVKEKGKKDFEILNATIYGFNYESGYNYTIAVKPTNNGNYYLANEISKKFVQKSSEPFTPLSTPSTNKPAIGTTNISSSSALDGKWYLRKMKEKEGASFVTDDNIMYIEINTFKDRIDGFGACNKFSAVLKSDLSTTFEISKMTSNLSNCGNKKIEELFYLLLQDANKFEVKNGHLILSLNWKYLLEFVSNPNDKEEIASTYIPAAIIEKENKTFATDQYKKETVNTPQTSGVNTSATDDLQKQVDALKKQLADKKAKEDAEIKKASEEQALQEQKTALLKQQIADKQAKEDADKRSAEEKQKQLEAATLKKQLEEKQAADKLQKEKEIDALKKQLAAMEAGNQPSKPISNSTPVSNITPTNTTEKEEASVTKSTTSEYAIASFKQNNSNNIPEPDFTLRPYYLDGDKLIRLERIEGIFVLKQKGAYRGTERFVNAMKPESELQFKVGNLPRIFIKLDDIKSDPYDIINLGVADVKKDRRTFIFRSQRLSGKVKDVTNKFINLEFKKIRDGLYEIIIDEDLDVGEYGFLPIPTEAQQNSFINSVKINCFGIAP